MKIVITGNTGFIGRYVTSLLESQGHEIIGLSRTNGYTLTDEKAFDFITKFDILIHLAANTFIPFSFKEPGKFYQENLSGTINALEACRKHSAKMIYMSSYIYGHPQYLPIDEKHPVHPANPYTHSKYLGEELSRSYNENFNVPVYIIRLFNVYGEGQAVNFLIPKILEQLKTGVISLQDPRPKRDFVHIEDVCNAIAKLVNYKKKFGIFNIGSGTSIAIDQIVGILSKANLIAPANVNFTGEQRENEVLDTIANISNATTELGWQPKRNFETELIKMAQKAVLTN